MCACVCVVVCLCVFKYLLWNPPIEAKFHVEPPWDSRRKFIQTVQVICCSSVLLSISVGMGAFSRDFTINPCGTGVKQGYKNWKVKNSTTPWPCRDRDYQWLVHYFSNFVLASFKENGLKSPWKHLIYGQISIQSIRFCLDTTWLLSKQDFCFGSKKKCNKVVVTQLVQADDTVTMNFT